MANPHFHQHVGNNEIQPWLPADGQFFAQQPQVQEVQLFGDERCLVIDNALAHPDALLRWASTQAYEAPRGYPYPGVVFDVPTEMTQRIAEFFALHVRGRLGARRTLDLTVRLSMVTTPPEQLEPRQWQCHRDRVTDDPRAYLFAASVLYLFNAPGLGGTSFYQPRLSAQATDQMLADSQLLSGDDFSARYGLRPGYQNGSNAYFERVAQVPAVFNRAIFYNGGLFHSADVDQPHLLSADPARGRLTLNSFFTCRRRAS